MTTKEKFEEAKRLYETANADQRYVLESLFPELKESEDERIRKALMQNLKERFGTKGNMGEGLDMPDVLTWLEKQGKHTNFLSKIQVGDKVTRNEDGELVNLSQLARVAKPDDKVEPKFHEGEWVVHKDGTVDQIEMPCLNVTTDKFGYDLVGGGYIGSEFVEDWHKWTIEEAKDGDVLHSPSHRLIWIYKDNEHYHTCVNMNYVTENIATNGQIVIPNDACPATKDEQTILFAMMKEAGYVWDAEKKELKKIEQKPAWSEEDEKLVKNLISTLSNLYARNLIEKETKEKYTNLLKSLKDRMQSKQEWSMYDETILKALIDHFEYKKEFNEAEDYDIVLWLKSLRPQSRWKPSDEQMVALDGICSYIRNKAEWEISQDMISDLYKLSEQLKKLREE